MKVNITRRQLLADAVTLLSAPMLFVIIGLAASGLAALRELKADPATILRVE